MKTSDDVLDPTAIADLLEEGDDLLIDLIEIFETEMSGNLRNIADTLASGDTKAIAMTAHKMKGTAGTLGAVGMQDLAAGINQAALDGSAEKVAEIFPRFGPECERVRDALRAERAKLSNPDAANPDGSADDS